IHLGEQPTIHPDVWNFEAVALAAIPIIAGLLQLVLTLFSQIQQKRTNPAAAQMKSMNIMMYIMPLFSVWFAYVVPAGVGFYWICSSFFSLIQTIALNLYFTPKRMEVIAEKEKAKMQKKAASGKKSMYQRVLEQQSAQDQSLNQHKNDAESETGGLSRKEKNVYNRKKIDEAREKFAEKYGDEISDDITEEADNDPRVIAARKRIAEKYGDRYED
ncbi:MAG: YidC/Oxa1 family membrane protein insertase, partial [Ruminococcus callidus]|nr:YidC/Oxa1 family membrane protein insertase [Ruminococcus callidus]